MCFFYCKTSKTTYTDNRCVKLLHGLNTWLLTPGCMMQKTCKTFPYLFAMSSRINVCFLVSKTIRALKLHLQAGKKWNPIKTQITLFSLKNKSRVILQWMVTYKVGSKGSFEALHLYKDTVTKVKCFLVTLQHLNRQIIYSHMHWNTRSVYMMPFIQMSATYIRVSS